MSDPVTPAPATPAPTDPAAAPSPATPPATPAAAAPPADPAAPATETLLAKKDEKPPEEIKIKFPDGVVADEALLGKFVPLAKDLKLNSEGAQKLVDLFAEAQKASETRHMEQITQWAEEAKTDKEIGGEAFDANLAIAKKAMDRLATPGLREVLIKSGLGNHKDVIKVFMQVGKLISEDRLPGGGATQQAGPTREDMIKEAFPASPQMFQPK